MLGPWRAVLTIAAGVLFATSACADDEDVTLGTEVPGPAEDAALPPAPAEDADVGDAGTDVLEDADAARRTCTVDGFCHVPLPEPQTLRGVWGDGTGVVWAVSEQGNVLRWDGNAWSIHTTVKGSLFAIWGSGPTDIWIGGEAGLLHGKGASSSQVAFTAVPAEGDIPITSIHGFGPNDVWAVGGRADWESEESRVLHYTGPTSDPADAWKLDPISTRVTAFSSVWGSSADDVWLGGSSFLSEPMGAVVLHGRRDGEGGTTFEPVEVGSGWRRLGRIGGGTSLEDVFVVGEYFSGIGVVWAGPRDGDAGEPRLYDDQHFDSWYTINAVWGPSKDDVWIAGAGGRVRHWNGTAWSLAAVSITKFPLTNDLHAVWGKPKGEMWIVGDGIVLRKNLAAGGGQ